jgi:RNA polymerase sigma-70 factor (ECF subfamily)
MTLKAASSRLQGGERHASGRRRLENLLARTANGDQVAFADLYAATELKMRTSVASLVPDAMELEDLLQDAYLKVWHNAHQYRSSIASPITWMIRVMQHCAIDRLRRPKLPSCQLNEEALAVADDPVDPLAKHEAARLFLAAQVAMRALPPARAELLSQAYIEGLSRSVLARRHGVPAATIKTWLRRSLATVREQMAVETLN